MSRKNNTPTLRIAVSSGASGANVNKSGRSQGAQKKKKGPSAPGKKKRGKAVAARRGVGGLTAYQRMLSDPCNSPLVPGLYGTSEGYLSRFHSIVAPQAVGGLAPRAGVILWCPKFHNPGKYGTDISTVAGTAGADYNLIVITTDASGSPLNFHGYGVGGTEVLTPGATYNPSRSQSFVDPAWAFVAGLTCSDARTLSACIRMSYTGTMSATQGMVAHIDVPLSFVTDTLIDGAANSSLTVDYLFATSQKVMRTSLEAVEQKWIPSEDGIFLSAASASNVRDIDSDVLISSTKGATPPTTGVFSEGNYARTHNPRIIGFAWRGFGDGSGASPPLQFDCYKNIEWKPEYSSGITVPRSVRTSVVPPVQAAVVALDSRGKSWTQEVVHEASSAASRIAKTALAFSGELVTHALGFN